MRRITDQMNIRAHWLMPFYSGYLARTFDRDDLAIVAQPNHFTTLAFPGHNTGVTQMRKDRAWQAVGMYPAAPQGEQHRGYAPAKRVATIAAQSVASV
jgi:hypothetical protein